MGRPKRAADGGWVYHLLNRANARLPIFEKDEDFAAFERVLEEAVDRTGTRLLSYCLMPNHWHLVAWPQEDGELSRFVGWLTLTHTQCWHAHRHSAGTGHGDMRIRLLTFPQHVVLRHENRWVSPMELELYLATMWQNLATTPRRCLYTAGGHIMETLFSTVAVIVLVQAGLPRVGFMVALMSAFLVGIGVLMVDLLNAWRLGHPAGDVSGLWKLAKLPTVVLVLALVAVRILLLWYAAA